MKTSELIKTAARGDQLRKLLSVVNPSTGIFIGRTPYFSNDLHNLSQKLLHNKLTPNFPDGLAEKGHPSYRYAANLMRSLKKFTTVVPNPKISDAKRSLRNATETYDRYKTHPLFVNNDEFHRLSQNHINISKDNLKFIQKGPKGKRVLRPKQQPPAESESYW